MRDGSRKPAEALLDVILALGEDRAFVPAIASEFCPALRRALTDAVFVVRKRGIVEAMIESAALGNEEEGYGRNADRTSIITASPTR
jgi:hypothetical protein